MAIDWAAERRWIDALPKVELHLHLEGAVPLDALWHLISRYGGDPSVPDRQALDRRFAYRDFPHFLSVWEWKNSFIRSYADFSFIAEAVARDLTAQQILYAEAFYSPADFSQQGLEPGPITEAIRSGLDKVPEIRVALVADLVRDFGPQRGARTLEQLAAAAELGVVGIGIGGSEHSCPPEPFAEVFAHARALGFRTSAHAGEAAGAASVWGAILALAVDRIGHGVRAVEDPNLLAHLAEHRIPLEVCPISNLRTGLVPRLEQHPIRQLVDSGVVVTVNTDDPKMFNTTMTDELFALRRHLGFSREEIRTLLIAAVNCTWLDKKDKRNLHARMVNHYGWSFSQP